MGLDRLSLSGPVAGLPASGDGWGSDSTRNPGTPQAARLLGKSVDVDGARVFVGVAETPQGPRGKVEGNPSRLVDPSGCALVTMDDAREVVEFMVDVMVGQGLTLRCAPEDLRVRRADFARDFRGVTSPSLYIGGLASVKRPYAKRGGVWQSQSHGGAQTLHAGSGSGMVRLYDQHEAYAERGAEPGSVRWEAECRSWLDEQAGIRTVGDLFDVARWLPFVMNRWEWSAMGVEVAATDAVVEKIKRAVEQERISATVASGLLGYMVLQAHGLRLQRRHETVAKYERLIRELGVTVGDLGDTSGAFVGRLDFERGEEVLRAA